MTKCSKCENIAVVTNDSIPFCVDCYKREVMRQKKKNKRNLWLR